MKRMMTSLLLLSSLAAFAQNEPTVVDRVLATRPGPLSSHGDGGSGVGGTVVYEHLIAWCDQASGILRDASVEGRESWGLRGDATEALTLFKGGLTGAATTATVPQPQSQTFTLRYVRRGLALSQILGVDDILDGNVIADRAATSLVNFFDWYLGFTAGLADRLDRPLYVPYATRHHRTDVQQMEARTVGLSVASLRELDGRFVRTLADRSNMYTNIPVPTYLRALGYMLGQVAGDLRDSLFAESYACQANRMDQLAEQIQRYLNQRQGNSLDAIRLNRFSLTLRNILAQLETRACH